jgi:DNA-binding transcriptional MerR regulator/effector-binding domain-containing protein
MTDVPLLRIGAFSRASSLSVKALRFYHEIGLLVPAVVDPTNGYRSYAVEQLVDATVVRRLRDLDVPVEDVRTVLQARDPEVTRKVLHEHRAALEERVRSMQDALEELYEGVETPELLTGVHERHEPARVVLQVHGRAPADQLDGVLFDAVTLLSDALRSSGAVALGPLGGNYPTQLDDEQDVDFFVPVADAGLLDADARRRGVRVATLPAVRAAVLVHQGPYETLGQSYLALGAWVAAHDQPEDTVVREHYLVSPFDTADPAEWQTEIVWPLRNGPLPRGGVG